MRSITFALVAFLLIIPLASAATTIKVQTLPGHDVVISIWSTDFGTQYAAPKKYLSDINGQVTHTYDGSESSFGVLVLVKAFGVEKFREEFPGPYSSGGTVELEVGDFTPPSTGEPDEEPEEEPVQEPEEPIDEPQTPANNSNNTNITGNSVSTGESSYLWTSETYKTVYYIIGGIFIVAIVAAIVMFMLSRMKSGGSSQYGMEPVRLNTKYKPDPSGDKYLDKIENEIQDVERQIDMYKKRSRLEDAQKRLEEKKRMLDQLKRGESPHQSHQHHEHNKYKKRFY